MGPNDTWTVTSMSGVLIRCQGVDPDTLESPSERNPEGLDSNQAVRFQRMTKKVTVTSRGILMQVDGHLEPFLRLIRG
jgi:hypothetical protein